MSSARLTRLLKTKSALLSLITVAPLVVVILGLAACVKHPVGDPEKSKVDPQYAGIWTRQESQVEEQLLFIRPYDRRTYLIFFFEFHVATDVIEPRGQGCYKAWLASIGDAKFHDPGTYQSRSTGREGREATLFCDEDQHEERIASMAHGQRGIRTGQESPEQPRAGGSDRGAHQLGGVV